MLNQTWQNSFLKLAGIGTYLTVTLVVIMPQAGNRTVADFEFPQQIKLNSKSIIESKPNRLKTDKQSLKASHQYQYIQDRQQIDLEINYLVDTRGDVEIYLQNHTSIAPEVIEAKQIEYIERVGYHALFATQDRAYLTSCISPRSLSNVTSRQFSSYRYQSDLRWQVGWQWLQGKASIRDRRCLWVNMSTPLTSNTQKAYQSLETAWQEVYQWWLPNFPPLHK